jgi:two-component system, chemotaxis family, CheB/CheR fusion protein
MERDRRKHRIGVLLSGLLRDGSEGLAAIKRAGGITMVQSPEEARFPDMPENAIAHAGAIDVIAPTAELARAIERYARGQRWSAARKCRPARPGRRPPAG